MRRQFELNLPGRSVVLGKKTIVMAIVNVTPDSFSDGGRYFDVEYAVAGAKALLAAGADWIDIGGESTRPGSTPVAAEEEIRRILPVIERLSRETDAVISVDTWKASVAAAALAAGAHIVNDITGLHGDLRMAETVRRFDAGVCLMHNAVRYRGDAAPGRFPEFGAKPDAAWCRRLAALPLAGAIPAYFAGSLARAAEAGIGRDRILLDPGFGFGLTREENLRLLAGLNRLDLPELPLLIGLSRKRFVRTIAGDDFIEQGSAAAALAAVWQGAHVVRVHDPATLAPLLGVVDEVMQYDT